VKVHSTTRLWGGGGPWGGNRQEKENTTMRRGLVGMRDPQTTLSHKAGRWGVCGISENCVKRLERIESGEQELGEQRFLCARVAAGVEAGSKRRG